MKKFVAILLAAVLVFTMAASALANRSISILVPEIIGSATITHELPEGLSILVEPVAESKDIWNPTVDGIVKKLNSLSEQTTLLQVVKMLLNLPVNEDKTLVNNKTLIMNNDGNELKIDLGSADFASCFSNIFMFHDGEAAYDLEGQPVVVELQLVYEQLKNRGAGEFVLFLIQPVTGEFTFIPLNAGDFNPETGEILVKLPFLGVFALVEL